ncbi:MAG: HD domain-containing phosphohydrolase [Planctomycetota bacterium]|jgi:putative nucleotidyltransferase with HDIG domain
MMRACIEQAGYNCLTACDGEEGLKVLATEAIDVVITDISMPILNGIELTRKVKEKYDSDVIIMTGHIDEFKYEDIVDLGASDFLKKPVSIRELILRLKRVLRERTILFQRNQAEDELKQSLEKLRRAFGGIINAMAETIEKRDPYTAGHQRKVANLAKAIAREIGLSQDQIEGLAMAGVIHDLGKISIPTEILVKPGQLTQFEFGIMKMHPKVGYDILKTIEFPWPVADIVLQHHERVDGSGYPQGITGKEILVEARILAVADVVEAMAYHRPYRPALGIDLALEEISKNRDTLYDSSVVAACLRLFRQKDYKLEQQVTSYTGRDRSAFNDPAPKPDLLQAESQPGTYLSLFCDMPFE